VSLDPVHDYIPEGQALFIEVFRDKPRLNAWLAAYLQECNALELALQETLFYRQLDNAYGVMLDDLGALVGQARVGLDDATYRLYIKVRVRVNRSKGRAADLIAVAALALGTTPFSYRESYPASAAIDVVDPTGPVRPDLLAGFIRDARGAGIGTAVVYSGGTSSDTFAFSDFPFPQADAGRGFSDAAQSVGGLLPGVTT
jgi:hypothetical protein